MNKPNQPSIGMFSLRNRLTLAYLIVVMLSVAAVVYFSNRLSGEQLVDQVGIQLQDQSIALTTSVARFIDVEIIGGLRVLGLNKIVQDTAEVGSNRFVPTIEVEAQFEQLDREWASASETSEFVRSVVGNEAGEELRELRSIFPNNAEVMVTDRYGALVAATNKTSDYIQSDEDWWQGAYNGGRGAIFISDPEYDVSADITSVIVAVPMYAHQEEGSQELVGIIRTTYSISAISNILTSFHFGETGEAHLYLSDGRVLSDDGQTFAQSEVEEVEVVHSAQQSDFFEGTYHNTSSLVAATAFSDVGEQSYLRALDWTVVLHEDVAEALQPVTTTTQATLGIGLLVAIVASVVGFSLSRFITNPINALTQVVQQLAGGDFSKRANFNRNDEIGVLASGFNFMAEQLQEIVGKLEARVAARTADLQTSSEIAAAANQVRDVSDLMSLTVNLIRDRFNFYYVQTYLVDQERKWAVLHDGTGYIGRKLLSRSHRLPLDGRSIVSYVIKNDEPYVVQDVSQDSQFHRNELLPETRAEITIPLRTKSGVIGVLDIQHSETDVFDENAQRLFQSLADQLAVTYENVQLFENTQKRAVELEAVAKVSAEATANLDIEKLLQEVSNLTRDSFKLYHAHIYLLDEAGENLVLTAGAGEVGRIMKSQGRKIALNHEHSLVARAARGSEGVIANDVTANPDFLPNPLLPETKSEMAVPMIVGDRVVGVLDVQASVVNRFDSEEVRVMTTLAGQVAVAVQNARSFTQTENLLAQTENLYSASNRIRQSNNMDDVLRAMVEWTPIQTLDRANIMLFNRTWDDTKPESATVVSVWEKDGRASRGPVGSVYPLAQYPIITESLRQTPLIVQDGHSEDLNDESLRQIMDRLGMRGVMFFPLISGNEWLGVLTAQSAEPYAFTDDQISSIGNLVGQAAVVVESIKLFDEIQARQVELTTLLENAPEAIIVVNTNTGLFESPNKNAEKLYGLSAEDLLKVGPAQMSPEFQPNGRPSMDMAMENIGAAMAGGTPVFDWTHLNSMGEEIPCEVRLVQMPGSQNHLVRASVTDISYRVRAEQQRQALFEIASNLTDAHTPDTVLGAISSFTQRNDVVSSTLLYIDNDDNGQPLWASIEASWSAENQPASEVGARYYLPEFPFSKFWMSNPDDVVMIENITTDERMDDNTRAVYESIGTKASALIPLYTQGRWIGLLVLSWAQPHTFSDIERNIYTAVRQQATSVVDAIRIAADVRTQREQLQSILDNSSAVIYVKAKDGKYILINKTYEDIFYLNNETLRGKTDYEIFPQEVAEGFWKEDQIVISTGETHQLEEVVPHPDGSIHTYFSVKFALRDAEGEIYAMCGMSTDVTERKQQEVIIQKRATEMETVAKVSAEATTNLNIEKLLVDVTNLTRDSFGLYHAHIYLLDADGENLVLAAGAGDAGQKMKELGHSIPVNRENSLVARAARTRQGVIVNDVTTAPDFLPNPFLPDTKSEMAIPMIVGDEVIGVLDVQALVANRFNNEDVRVKTTLAGQVAVAVRNARAYEHERQTVERLREVDRLKQQFLANMSHELRTPLNSIIGYAEVLLDGVDGELTEEAVEDVHAIHGSGKHLLTIINEILDLAKIDAGQMQLDRKDMNLVALLEEIVKSGQVLVKDKPVQLELVHPNYEFGIVNADLVRMRQIMWNLVSNAIKFTEEGQVVVSYGLNQDDNMIYVKVEDTGIGMGYDDLSIIFDRFRQADGSSTRRAGGTGLGLAITRELVQMHGGDIHVESEAGVGSKFWFTIPATVADKV